MRAVIPLPASRAVTALLAVVTSAAGCATKGDLRNVQTEIRALAARQDSVLAELRRQRALTVDTLGRQTRELTADLRGDVSQRLRDIDETLDRLEELAGQNANAIASLRNEMVAGRRPVAGDPVAASESGMEGDVQGAPPPDSLYDMGYRFYVRNSFGAARTAFNQFLELYPRDELAARVHGTLADMLAQEGLLEEAIQKYLIIPEEFPADPEVPNALYRAALLEIDRGDEDAARRRLQLIINTYPDDPMAELAQDRLDELGG